MGVYYCEPKASHCECPYRSYANISSYLWSETMSRDLYGKLMNTNQLSRCLYQKLILLLNNHQPSWFVLGFTQMTQILPTLYLLDITVMNFTSLDTVCKFWNVYSDRCVVVLMQRCNLVIIYCFIGSQRTICIQGSQLSLGPAAKVRNNGTMT